MRAATYTYSAAAPLEVDGRRVSAAADYRHIMEVAETLNRSQLEWAAFRRN